MTVPVRRGGPLSLVLPIPPATISFHATATVHPAGTLDERTHGRLASLVPASRRIRCHLIEIRPVGQFVTYGLDVSLNQMRDPAVSGRRLPVG